MNSKFDCSKLTPEGIAFSLFFFTSVISPGYVYFYLFHGQFFNSTDWIKLLFLSAGITLPFLIFNTLMYATLLAIRKKDNKGDIPTKYFKDAFMSAAWMTLLAFYGFIILRYLANFISSREFVFAIVAIEGLYALIIVTLICVDYFKHKNASSS